MQRIGWLWLGSAVLAYAEPSEVLRQVAPATVKAIALVAEEHYTKALHEAQGLAESLRGFAAAPSPATLAAARTAWRKARSALLRVESLRFTVGPIDDDDGPQPRLDTLLRDNEVAVERQIDSFQHAAPPSAESLLRSPEALALCGFPALEFCLWHRDSLAWSSAHSAFLQACAGRLVEDLESVVLDWQAGKLGNYRAIEEEGVELSVRRILTGMSLLSGVELAAGRLQMALDTRSSREVPSWRSGSTKEDLIASTVGLQDFWQALRPLVAALDASLAVEMTRQFETSVHCAEALQEPFHEIIQQAAASPGRTQIESLIVALDTQADSLRSVAQRWGFILPVEITAGDE